MHYWISQQTSLKNKRDALLEERRFYEDKLKEVNEKLEANETNLAKADSKIEEYSPLLQEATISSTTIARHKRAFAKVVTDSNAVLTKFRDCIVNNL